MPLAPEVLNEIQVQVACGYLNREALFWRMVQLEGVEEAAHRRADRAARSRSARGWAADDLLAHASHPTDHAKLHGGISDLRCDTVEVACNPANRGDGPRGTPHAAFAGCQPPGDGAGH